MKKGWSKNKLKKAIEKSVLNSSKLEGYEEPNFRVKTKVKKIIEDLHKKNREG